MNKRSLFRAIGDVSDQWILDAEPLETAASRKKPFIVWRKWAAMAACIMLACGGLVFYAARKEPDTIPEPDLTTTTTTTTMMTTDDSDTFPARQPMQVA